MQLMRGSVLAFLGLAMMAGSTMAQDKPSSLGTFRDWSAYTAGSGSGKICYVLSQPTVSEPKGAKRDPIYFLISDFPDRKAKAEPQVVPGYPYKDGSTVSVVVGSDKFTLFTKNEGGTGAAWMKAQADEAKLVAAMQKGSRAIVTGTSSRGTVTKDTFSLSGITAALNKAHAECKM